MRAVVRSLLVAAVLVQSGSLLAAPSRVAVDAKASSFEWKGSKVTGSTHNGTVEIKLGEIQLEGNKLVGGKIVVDMNTIKDLDLTDKGYNDKLVTHLKSDDFFDVVKYPTATITIKESVIEKDGSYKVKGDLQIKNETHPVSFVAKLSASGKEAETELTIDRTEWNIRYGSGKFFKGLGDKMISDKMDFKVKLVFESAVGAAVIKK